MSFKPVQFTYDEVQTIRSSFQTRQLQLSSSGDYPEREADAVIMGKILDWLYTAPHDINLATRSPKGGDLT